MKIKILYGKTIAEIINVLHPFLGCGKTFSRDKVHNIIVWMLNPCFKGMDCIMDYIGKDQVTTLVQQYDDLIMMPMLETVIGFLNPHQIIGLNCPPPKQPLIPCGLFGSVTSSHEITKGLFKVKLSLFHKFHVENVDSLDPLMWWVANESKFPNVGSLA
jgi:hypothetical protein